MTSSGSFTPLRRPSSADLCRLQQLRGQGFVTVTLDTTDGKRLSTGETTRLERLLADAESRLAIEPLNGALPVHRVESSRIIAELKSETMRTGLVILIGDSLREAYLVGTPPGDRVVVDPTFATRDLAMEVWSSPEVLLLVLSSNEAKLFLAAEGNVSSLEIGGFPAHRAVEATGRGGRRQRPRRSGSTGTDRFLDLVGLALRSVYNGRPVVLIAAEPVGSAMQRRTTVPFLGVVPGNRLHASPTELWALTEPLRRHQVQGRRRGELQRRDRLGAKRTAAGVPDVWDAVSLGRVETLLVDPTYRWAGVPSDDGFVAVDDPAMPGAIDDVVDDLIETVSLQGGTVCFVEPGDLGSNGVQAVLRR